MRVLALCLLALFASADALSMRADSPTADVDCPAFCTREYMPVCGSDGVKYSNKCMFESAQCLNPSLTLVECAK